MSDDSPKRPKKIEAAPLEELDKAMRGLVGVPRKELEDEHRKNQRKRRDKKRAE